MGAIERGDEGVKVFVFGLGYSAQHFASLFRDVYSCSGTVTSAEKATRLGASGIDASVFSPDARDDAIEAKIAAADALLVSIPPDEDGDPVLKRFARQIASAPNVKHIVYLSTVGVYGDHQGAWIDESTHCHPVNERSIERLAAERAWTALGEAHGIVVHILRLSGIYGPGSNALVNLKRGVARRIIKPGQVFNRIHVEDIAGAIDACFSFDGPGAIWNVTDDLPAPAQDVVTYAAQLMGIDPPPEVDFETFPMSPMARSFYSECKRVSNKAMRDRLGVKLAYPTYREALNAMWAQGEGR